MADNSETIDEVVGIKLELEPFENDPEKSIESYFDKIKEAAAKQKWSSGSIAQALSDSLANLMGQSQTRQWNESKFKQAWDIGQGQIKNFLDSVGLGKLTRDAETGDISKELFGKYVVPRGDLGNFETWFRRDLIDKATYFGKKLPVSSIEELRKFYQAGDIDRSTYLGFADARVNASGLSGWRQRLARWDNHLIDSPESLAFRKRWDEAALGVGRFYLSLKALQAPFRSFIRFSEQLREINLQFGLLAQHANMTASALAAQSGLFSAFGSNRGFANYANAFTMAMEQRRIGLGDGGQFTRALMYYGIQFDPNSLDATTRNIVAFMSNPNRTDAQKLSAGRMLGWDDSMIAAAKRGNAFYAQYTAEMQGLTTHKSPATEAAMELSLETNKLKAAFGDLKDMLFASVAPALNHIVAGLTKIVKFFNDNSWLTKILAAVGIFYGGAKAIGAALSLWSTGKTMLAGLFRLATGGIAGGIGGGVIHNAVATVGGATAGSALQRIVIPAPAVNWGTAVRGVNALGRTAGGVAGGAAAAGGAASRMAGKAVGLARLGPWGAVLGVVDAVSGVTNTIMGGIQRHNTNVRLDAIYALLDTRIPANLASGSIARGSSSVDRSITVQSMTVTVTSNATDPDAVADSFRKVIMDEFRQLAYDGPTEVA